MEYRDQFRIPPTFLIVMGVSLTTTMTFILYVGWTDLGAFVTGLPTEEGATMFWVLLSVIALEAGVAAMILSWCNLRINARGVGILYRPIVWSWKWRSWADIRNITLVNISPIGDFGGWGLRVGGFGSYKNVHAYTFNEGVYALIELHSGRTIAFQIRHLEHFKAVLQACAPNLTIDDPKNLLGLQT